MKKIFFFLIIGMLLLAPILLVRAQTDYASIIQQAAKNGDVSLCSKIDIPTGKDACLLAVAVATGNIKLCGTMSDISKLTYQDKVCKATVTLDTKYCDEISDSTMKANCYSIMNENKKRGNAPPAQSPAVQPPSQTKPECTTDKNCGDNICSNGKCVEPKLTFLFVPLFWQGTNDKFDKSVDENMNILLNAIPLKSCKSQVKVLKLHTTCNIPDYPKSEFYRTLYDIKKCAERYATSYDYIIGLTDRWDSFFGVAGGFAVPGFPVTLATTSAPYIPAHEIGHSFGLKEEYCAGGLNKALGKCGFDIKKNPLKSEYGCREKDSLYDKDDFSDCCTSNGYLSDACTGNVGVSEARVAEDIYNAGIYDTIDEILKDAGFIYNNIESCSSNSRIKDMLNNTLIRLKDSTDKLYDIQKTTKFEFGSVKNKLDDVRDYFISRCLADSNLCGCINKNNGVFKSLYSNWQDTTEDKLPSYPRAFNSLIKFNTRNIMTGPATLDIRSGPFEFSKPAYDYLATLPQMQCPSVTSTTPITSETTTSTSVSEADKNSFYWNINWIDLNGATTEKENSITVSSGQKVSGRFAYNIWNAPTCGPQRNICDCIDNLVLGTENEPLYCFKAGIPWCYPGKSGDTSFSFNAPASAGAYTIYYLTTQTYNCNDAFGTYKTATNKKAVGKLTVSG